MGLIQDVLSPHGLKVEDFSSAERESLNNMLEAAETHKLTPQTMKSYVRRIRFALDNELHDLQKNDIPHSWVSLLSLFFPIYGVVKKWYEDRRKLYVEARIRNLILIESFLVSPDRAKEQLSIALEGFAKRVKAERDARRAGR